MVEWTAFLVYSFPQSTLYALWFLLGSHAVSGLSDIRRMAAQREFMEVWIAFVAVLFLLESWRVYQGADSLIFGVKWGLVLLFSLLSWRKIGGLFRLARGDVWAIAAVCSLFNPLFVVLYVLILKVVDLAMRPLLRAFGSGGAYPFIPAVLVATLVTVAIIQLQLVGRLLGAAGVA